jgi:hypothetical protein
LPSGITLNTNDPNNAIVEIRGVVFIYNEPTTDAAPAEAGTVDSSVAITQ